jgi:hypothetical protein
MACVGGRLPFRFGVELGAEQHGDSRQVQPEDQDYDPGESAVRLPYEPNLDT